MGTVTKSIGTNSRDYSTLQAWEDALPADLVADGNSQVGECYNDSEFTATGRILTIGGLTTSSTYTIKLTTAAGQSFRDHASVQTNALKYNQSNGVGLRFTSGAWTRFIDISVNYITVENLQIKTDTADNTQVINFYGGGNLLQNCIFDCNCPVFGDVRATTISNCLFILRTTGSALAGSGGSYVYGCTFVIPSDAAVYGTQTGSYRAWSTVLYENCAFFGFGTCIANDNNTITVKNCITDLAAFAVTLTEQGTNLKNKTYANQFQDTTLAAMDYRLKSGSDCLDAGFTESATPTDIVGTSRPQGGAYDIGCWEKVVPPNPRLGDMNFMGI